MLVFLSRKLKLIVRNFDLVGQRKEIPFVVRPVTRGNVLEVSPWRVMGRSAEETIWEKVF